VAASDTLGSPRLLPRERPRPFLDRVPAPAALLERVDRTGALRRLLDPPPRIRLLGDWAVFVLFAAQLALIVPRHEPWFDEAQAWLLARDATPWELVRDLLRYEGSPGLWHALLMVPAKLGAPYWTMQLAGALAAVAGAALLAFRSPFPLVLKAGLAFSYVIGYQYAAVARSYTLVPVALFLVALAWPGRERHIGRLAWALALLANVTLHGFLIAGSVAAVRTFEALRDWRRMDRPAHRAHLVAASALLLMAAAFVVVLYPPEDLSNARATPFSPTHWALFTPGVVNSSLTGNWIASTIAVVVSAVWFRRTRTLLLWGLPTLALVSLSALRYHSPWHDGLPFMVWVFALWVSLRQPVRADRLTDWTRLGALGVLGGVLIVQVVWWAQSWWFDWQQPYSGNEELAAYLEQLPPDTEVYASSFHAVGALPYLDDNILANYNQGELPAYYTWSTDLQMAGRVMDIYLGQPDVVVWGVKFGWQEDLPELPGYRRSELFEGNLYWKNRVIERDAYVVYEREA